MHAAFSFIAEMQPRALLCPGVSKPLEVLTGKESDHQRAGANGQPQSQRSHV